VKSRILTGTAFAAALALSTIAAAGAQNATTMYPGGPGQYDSNVNVQKAANHVGKMINALEKDNRDYAGHRVSAINDLSNARNELIAAEQYAQSHGYGTQQPPHPVHVPNPGAPRHSENRSNYQIAHVQMAVQRMISHLQRDSRDYGGHRVAAINWLNQANTELGLAVQWEQSHPNG